MDGLTDKLGVQARVKSVSGKFWRGAGAAGAALLAAQLLGLASARIVSNILGPDEYGRFGLALVFGICSYQFMQWGIDPLLTRALARADRQAAAAHLAGFLRQRQVSGVLALLAGAVLALAWPAPHERTLVFLGIMDGVMLGFSVPAAFDARGSTPRYFVFCAIRQGTYLFLIVLTSLLLSSVLTSVSVLFIHLCAIGLQVALEWRWTIREYGRPVWSGAGESAWQLWREALPMAAGLGAIQLQCAIGPPALEAFAQQKELGYLVASNQIAIVMSSFLNIPGRMVHARLSKLEPRGPEFSKNVFLITVGFCLIGAAVAAVLASLSGYVIWGLFGSKFSPAAEILAVDAWRSVGVLGSGVLGSALICQKRLSAFALCHLLAFAASLALAAAGIPEHGARAAAASVAMGRFAFVIFAGLAFAFPLRRRAFSARETQP